MGIRLQDKLSPYPPKPQSSVPPTSTPKSPNPSQSSIPTRSQVARGFFWPLEQVAQSTPEIDALKLFSQAGPRPQAVSLNAGEASRSTRRLHFARSGLLHSPQPRLRSRSCAPAGAVDSDFEEVWVSSEGPGMASRLQGWRLRFSEFRLPLLRFVCYCYQCCCPLRLLLLLLLLLLVATALKLSRSLLTTAQLIALVLKINHELTDYCAKARYNPQEPDI